MAERLRHATAEGRLTPDELDERLEILYSSRTYGELDSLVDDLPVPSSHGQGRERSRRWVAPAITATIVLAVLGMLTGGVHRTASVAQGQGHPPPFRGPDPLSYGHNAIMVGVSALGVVAVLAVCAAFVWLLTHSGRASGA